MREKKPYKIITFRTTTAAMAMEKQCMAGGLPGRLIPVPREITAGCGLAWRISVEDYKEFEQQFREFPLEFERIEEISI